METSWVWPVGMLDEARGLDIASVADFADGIAFGSWLLVFNAGPESCSGEGEGGGDG
jgi:hypothetical protein